MDLDRDLATAEATPGLVPAHESPVPCHCVGPRSGQRYCPCLMEHRRNYYRVPGTPTGASHEHHSNG